MLHTNIMAGLCCPIDEVSQSPASPAVMMLGASAPVAVLGTGSEQRLKGGERNPDLVEHTVDDDGSAIATMDAAGRTTCTYYAGVDPCQNYTPSGQADRDLINQTLYDRNGNAIATIDPAGRVNRTYYDALNRPQVTIQNLTNWEITNPAWPTFDSTHPDQNLGTQTFYDAQGRAYRTVDLTRTSGTGNWTCYDEVAKAIGVTDHTYYRWRKEYGGLRTDQAQRLKELEVENSRLKKLVADLSLDNAIIKEALRGK
jgi:putative transposase